MNETLKKFYVNRDSPTFADGFAFGMSFKGDDAFWGPFGADGRKRAVPPLKYGANALTVHKSAARATILRFLCRKFTSQHSAAGQTTWIIIEWCQHHGISVKVTPQYIGNALAGYTLEAELAG